MQTTVTITHRQQIVVAGHISEGEKFLTYGVNAPVENFKAVAKSAVTGKTVEFWTPGAAEYWLKTHAYNNLK
jgi:hypothetical protein